MPEPDVISERTETDTAQPKVLASVPWESGIITLAKNVCHMGSAPTRRRRWTAWQQRHHAEAWFPSGGSPLGQGCASPTAAVRVPRSEPALDITGGRVQKGEN